MIASKISTMGDNFASTRGLHKGGCITMGWFRQPLTIIRHLQHLLQVPYMYKVFQGPLVQGREGQSLVTRFEMG